MSLRATLTVAAKAQQTEVLNLARASCPFSSIERLMRAAERKGCHRFNRRVLSYLRSRPDVSTILVSHQQGGYPYPRGNHRTSFQAEVAGFVAQWRALPDSVDRVVVVRDWPTFQGRYHRTVACLKTAQAERREPGPACARRRSETLRRDAAVVASRADVGRDVEIVDLTRFFCTRRRCLPVVGGALIYTDGQHLTRAFATSLGPYLGDALPGLW
jgi:hypothetical protein